jgi:hypothetical protein
MRLLLWFTLASWALPAFAQRGEPNDDSTVANPTEGSQRVDGGEAGAATEAGTTGIASDTLPRESNESRVPPPPGTPSSLDGPREQFRFGDVVPAGLGEALWARDRDAALAAIDAASSETSEGVACAEAVLRDLSLRAEYLPSVAPVDRLSARLFADTRARVTRTFEDTLRAHRRCLASGFVAQPATVVVSSGPVQVELDVALQSLQRREAELSSFAARIASDDPVLAHAGLADAVGIDLDSSPSADLSVLPPSGDELAPPTDRREENDPSHVWNVASAFYVASHGRLPTPDERKVEPNWRLTPLVVGAMELVLGLALIPATARASGGVLDDARVRLGLVGLAVSGVVSLILSPTWLERDRRARLVAGGLTMLASIGLGLGTALADVRPRLRAFGVTLATTSVVDVAFWVGGAVIQRRWRPSAAVSRHHTILGGTYVF